MKKKSFGIKDKIVKFESKGLLLSVVQLIKPQDPEIFQILKADYEQINKSSKAAEKAALSLIGGILTHKRIYFAMTVKSLKKLMLSDPNIPDEFKSGFSPNDWSRLLSCFYNDLGLIKLKYPGVKRKASAFEVIDPELLAYLTPKVDAEAQLAETLKFCQKKG